jgi:hypothetical protein
MQKINIIKNVQYEKVTDLIAELLIKYRREIESLDISEVSQTNTTGYKLA